MHELQSIPYNSIHDDVEAYQALLDAHDPGVDYRLSDILAALRDIEERDLRKFGLTQAFSMRPPGAGAKPPFIVHLPQDAEFTPVSTLDDGYAGLEMQVKWRVDIFIAGGHSHVPYYLAMMTSYSIMLELCMLLLKNPSVKGTCRGVELANADPQAMPLTLDDGKTIYTWQGISVHAAFNCAYSWRAG